MTELMQKNPRIKNVAEYLDQLTASIELDKKYECKLGYGRDTAEYKGVCETLTYLGYTAEYKNDHHIIY